MAADREVHWSDEASVQVDAIKAFMLHRWTTREVEVFLDLLHRFEKLVVQFPNGYQRSEEFPGCRRAVIHPNVSVVYCVTRMQLRW